MTLSIEKLQAYAKTRNTRVIEGAYKIAPGGASATFVLESGPKLTMTEAEINAALKERAEATTEEVAVKKGKAK